MTARTPALRTTAALALAATLAGAACFGPGMSEGAAAAQPGPSVEVRSLQARIDQLSVRVAALDAMIAAQGTVTTVSGPRRGEALILRANPDTLQLIRVGDRDAALSFRRITINADEIALNGKQAITLKAPAITLDGAVQAKGGSEIVIKGSKVGSN